MAVITISRQYGIGGIELTKKIAQRLGYHFYSREIAVSVAKKMGLDHRLVMEYQAQMAYKSNWLVGAYAGRLALFEAHSINQKQYQGVVSEVVQNLAQEDDLIILGWGGQCILQNHPHTFHFRIVADLKTRLAHILSHYRNPEDIPTIKMLEHRIFHMDKARRKYIRTHFKMNIENPCLYHAIFNLTELGKEKVVSMIEDVVMSKQRIMQAVG